MMNIWGSVMLLVFAGCATPEPSIPETPTVKRLKVADTQRHLAYEDGSVFFWLGDTAWELFHRLNREEAYFYLEDRAQKGFTVIQAVALAELDGLNTPNPYGHTPLIDNDPAQPDTLPGPANDYWDHVDYIVEKAESLGMYIGLLPTWGDKFNQKWGVGPVVFTPENAEAYGQFLGERYKDNAVIWILGGDRNPESDEHLAIIRAMAAGIEASDGINLMTYHPQGDFNSAEWFHNDPWLDFNMFQSGHGSFDKPNYTWIESNYALTPIKPTLEGEPRYEDHPVNWNPDNGWFDDFDVRQAAYWPMLSGAFGHTYGNHNIWQMWQPGREPISSARTPWREAVSHIGSTHMGYMRQLFEARPFFELIPDQTLIATANPEGPEHMRAARAQDGSYLFMYTPYGDDIAVQMDAIAGDEAVAYWFNPRTNTSTKIGRFETSRVENFDPPNEPERGNDWVLVIDDASKGWPAPGMPSE